MKEIWKSVLGYEGLYMVSSTGIVRNSGLSTLKPSIRSKTAPYLAVSLTKNGRSCSHFLHRVVATAFLENKSDLPFVNHIDGVKTNNSVENLEWVSATENMRHAIQKGLLKKGNENHRRVLRDAEVEELIKRFTNGESRKCLAKAYGCSRRTVHRITVRGEAYSNGP